MVAFVSVILLRRKIGQPPPVYPNGWFRIMDSSSLEVGQVKSTFAFGKYLLPILVWFAD